MHICKPDPMPYLLHLRESKWTESIAVGSKFFVEDTKERLGIRGKGRNVIGNNGVYELREPRSPYL